MAAPPLGPCHWPKLPERQTLLKAKIEFLRRCADYRHLQQAGLAPEAWDGHMQNVRMAEAIGLTTTSLSSMEALNAQMAKLVNGEAKVKLLHLVGIARHARLSPRMGEPEQAAWLLSDGCSLTEFRRRLVAAGWADPEAMLRGVYASRDLFLAALSGFNMARGGLRVGDARQRGAAPMGLTRGAELPRPGDWADDLPDHALRSALGLLVEDLDRPRGLLLLELGPAPERLDGHAVSSLVPSQLAPRPVAEPGRAIPTDQVHGLAAYMMEGPAGRYDWLAVLTAEPLSPPWPWTPGAIHRLAANDVAWLMRELRRLGGDDDGKAAQGMLEIRHYPFTLGVGRG